MAEATTDIQTPPADADAQRLDAMVDQLVSEIDQAIETIQRSHRDDDNPAPEHTGADDRADDPVGESLDDQVETLIAEATAEATDQIVDQPIDQPADEAADADIAFPITNPADATHETPPTIEQLDEQLASAVDDEFEGDFESVSEFTANHGAHDTSAQPDDDEPAQPVRRPAPAATGAMPSLVARPATPPAADKPDETALGAPAPRRRSAAATAAPAAAAAAARIMAKPLTLLGPGSRDTIGWFAVNTLFLAACVWLYAILRR